MKKENIITYLPTTIDIEIPIIYNVKPQIKLYKRCSKCKEVKSLNEYYKNKNEHIGHSYSCKSCEEKYKKNKYATDFEYRLKIRNYSRNYMKKYKIIINNDYIDNIFNTQNGRCAICGKHQSELKNSLCVDHDHITNNLRGLLCTKCNLAIGNLEDNIESLKAAIVYLEKYKIKNPVY
jgi:Recombination endonuclease VII